MSECSAVSDRKHIWLYVTNDKVECKICGQKSDIQTLKMIQSIERTVPDAHVSKALTECETLSKLAHGWVKVQLPICIDLESNMINDLRWAGNPHKIVLHDLDRDNFVRCEVWMEPPKQQEKKP